MMGGGGPTTRAVYPNGSRARSETWVSEQGIAILQRRSGFAGNSLATATGG